MAVFDIATMGSSLTCGNAPGVTASWHRDLEDALKPGKSSRIRTYNFGVGGGNYLTGLSLVGQVINLRPRVVLIEYSMNDCNLDYVDAQAGTIDIIDQIKVGSPDSAIYLMTMNKVFGDQLTLRGDLPDFYQMYRNLAVSENVGLIDARPAFESTVEADYVDSVHPKAETNKAVLVPEIVSVLGSTIT